MSAAESYQTLALAGLAVVTGAAVFGVVVADAVIRRLGTRIDFVQQRLGWVAECVDPRARFTPDPDDPEAWDYHVDLETGLCDFRAGKALFLNGVRLNIFFVRAVSAKNGCVLFDGGTLAVGDVLILPANAVLQGAGE